MRIRIEGTMLKWILPSALATCIAVVGGPRALPQTRAPTVAAAPIDGATRAEVAEKYAQLPLRTSGC